LTVQALPSIMMKIYIADHNNDIWVATHTKINKLHNGEWQSEYVWSETSPWQYPNNNYVFVFNTKIMEDSGHDIWVCSNKGVMMKGNN
jgi:hypothetical protein